MKPFLIAAFLYVPALWAQDDGRRPLSGLIAGPKPSGVSVVNRATEKSVESIADGHFLIDSKPGDTLVFASSTHQLREIKVAEKDFDGNLLVTLQPAIALDEVVVEKNKITAASVGIPGASIFYTPAQRKFATGSGQNNMYGLNTQISLDGIINGLSGKTAELRKNIVVEKKENLIETLESWFDESFYTRQLSIPAEYVKGFLFYLAENGHFAQLVRSGQKTTVSFLMTQAALAYKDKIACEQE